MISIIKTKEVPTVLNNTKAQKEFQKNIEEKKYAGNDIYRRVKTGLEKIYQGKCAYCETNTLAGAHNHIEHYRPNNKYYWLAFSWDNLLISCPKCNEKKGNHFYINSKEVKYNDELLSELHSITPEYDGIEEPLLINPEQETQTRLKEYFTFKTDGSIKSNASNSKIIGRSLSSRKK